MTKLEELPGRHLDMIDADVLDGIAGKLDGDATLTRRQRAAASELLRRVSEDIRKEVRAVGELRDMVRAK